MKAFSLFFGLVVFWGSIFGAGAKNSNKAQSFASSSDPFVAFVQREGVGLLTLNMFGREMGVYKLERCKKDRVGKKQQMYDCWAHVEQKPLVEGMIKPKARFHYYPGAKNAQSSFYFMEGSEFDGDEFAGALSEEILESACYKN